MTLHEQLSHTRVEHSGIRAQSYAQTHAEHVQFFCCCGCAYVLAFLDVSEIRVSVNVGPSFVARNVDVSENITKPTKSHQK